MDSKGAECRCDAERMEKVEKERRRLNKAFSAFALTRFEAGMDRAAPRRKKVDPLLHSCTPLIHKSTFELPILTSAARIALPEALHWIDRAMLPSSNATCMSIKVGACGSRNCGSRWNLIKRVVLLCGVPFASSQPLF